MIAALVLAAFSLQPPPAPTLRDVQDRLASCGIAPDRVALRYERELQLDVVFIAGRGVPSADTLGCVARMSVETGRLARFDDPDADTLYGDVWGELVQRTERERARQWLADAGRLEQLPVFDAQRQTSAAFGRRLEAFCGIPPGAALRVEAGLLAMAGTDDVPRLSAPQRDCIVNAATAAGFVFGFIGRDVPTTGEGKAER
jgi:hypothetical protein